MKGAMEQKRYEFILEAREPISHAEGTIGNVSVIMRQRVRQRDGSFAQVPIITGDTMRHGLREAAAYALLDAAGMMNDTLTEAALRLLFSGGMVTGSAGDAVKLNEFRELLEFMPPLALLGGCVQNRVVPGRMQVAPALLICAETLHHLPAWVLERLSGQAIGTARAHVEHVQRVRMDPTLDPAKRLLLTPAARAGAEQRLLASEAAGADGDVVAVEKTKSTMMPFSYETVAQGSLFYWSVSATCHNEIDNDTLLVMLAAFLSNARVGGKRGTGHGLLVPVAALGVDVQRPSERTDSLDLAAPGSRFGERFRAHVAERAGKLRAFFAEVNA